MRNSILNTILLQVMAGENDLANASEIIKGVYSPTMCCFAGFALVSYHIYLPVFVNSYLFLRSLVLRNFTTQTQEYNHDSLLLYR